MKKLVKKLPLVAFVFALVAAFAFNMPEEDELQWFTLNDDGDIGSVMPSGFTCPGDGSNCAVGLDEDQAAQGYTNVSQIPGSYSVEEKSEN